MESPFVMDEELDTKSLRHLTYQGGSKGTTWHSLGMTTIILFQFIIFL